MARSEAEQILRSPTFTVSGGQMEIIAYQAEQIGDALYSIRVAYIDGRVSQCYMGYELCKGDARPKAQKKSERLQLLLVVVIAAALLLVYWWWKNR